MRWWVRLPWLVYSVLIACGCDLSGVQLVRGDVGGHGDGGLLDSGVSSDGGSLARQLMFTSPAHSVRSLFCSPQVTVQLSDELGQAVRAEANLPIDLSATPQGSIHFYADPGCLTTISSVPIPAGSSNASFHFVGETSGTHVLTATAVDLAPGVQSHQLLPVVRTGTCNLAAGQASASCNINPSHGDLHRSLLSFQATGSDDAPAFSNVVCALIDGGTLSCDRTDAGAPVAITWQSAEHPALDVQHFPLTCEGVRDVVLPIRVVDPNQSFLLYSKNAYGNDQDDDDLGTVRFATPTTVQLSYGRNCNLGPHQVQLQVVQYAGASVTRGLTGAMTGDSLAVTGLSPVDPERTFLLFTYRWEGSGAAVCHFMIRGWMDSPTSLRFSRASNQTSCIPSPSVDGGYVGIDQIAWERVELPAGRVSQHYLAVPSTTSTQSVTLGSPVDVSRTLVFASNQVLGGQGGGEVSFTSDDVLGAAVGTLTLVDDSTLRVDRLAPVGVARFTVYTVELGP